MNELKTGWANAGHHFKKKEDLEKMKKMIRHPVIKRIRTRLLMQVAALSLFLLVYYDWFDGDKRPMYANLALVTGLVMYLLNDILGYLLLIKPVGEASLKQSLLEYLTRVKKLSVLSVMVTLLYSTSLFVFFTATIAFSKEKWLTLLFSTVIVFQLIRLSSRLWSRWIKKLNQQIADFSTKEEGSAG